MKMPFPFLFASSLLLISCGVLAANPTPIGTWRTFDDHTHQPRSIIQISDHNGELRGIVKQVLNATAKEIARDGNPPRCSQCSGARKNQSIIGMTIMWGMHKDGESWTGGHILDPNKGSIYKVTLTLLADGRQLKVRGYVGLSLLGRSQIWERVEPKPASSTPLKGRLDGPAGQGHA